MKDYRLSEVQAICVKRKRINAGCVGCEMEEFCFALSPACVDIEPRDIIELPCKIANPNDLPTANWQVIWRKQEGGCIETRTFSNETDADMFLAYLKRG